MRARIIEHCSFDYMKRNAAASVPLGGAFWGGGAELHSQGHDGHWKDLLPPDLSDA